MSIRNRTAIRNSPTPTIDLHQVLFLKKLFFCPLTLPLSFFPSPVSRFWKDWLPEEAQPMVPILVFDS